ncbi:threonine/serine exporter family protein [Moraxella sp. Tifton1]|uniref:threonine/serine ThrE exporter family protein n=1 Tax=Moraxella oculi TaxID=2940516 RepID=UPI002012695E|nr:threonine/serine exporter family protein [Moraxella sp. Tifton1]MCL1623385.1 threonine/serine exporter family protein [Moraxella sp. Tifton1]
MPHIHSAPSHLSHEQQQRITRLCVRCALLFMQYGGESAVVVDLTKRLGVSLGVDGVECALSFNAITLTTLYDGRCITTARNTVHQGINVSILVQIQQIVMNAESNFKNNDFIDQVESQFDHINRATYSNNLMALFVSLSCACFAYLNGGNFVISLITMAAAFCAMRMRLYLSSQHFNPFVVVIITAFVATILGASAYFLDLNDWISLGDTADIAVAASVLLLVPSFPIINALSDMLKGYINMGVGRWMFSTMLTLSACVGIVIALILLQIPHWGL